MTAGIFTKHKYEILCLNDSYEDIMSLINYLQDTAKEFMSYLSEYEI